MSEEFKGWENTCNRFVAFLDIMGFKDMVQRKKPDDITNIFNSLYPTIEEVKKSAYQWQKRDPNKTTENIVDRLSPIDFIITFSDSIILISCNRSIISAVFILSHVERIFSAAINTGIPIKGVIACGEMTVDTVKSLYFGQPLIDAYELNKELQFYGIVLHHTTEQYLREIEMISATEGVESIVRYPVPMKYGEVYHYTIDWTISLNVKGVPFALVEKMYNGVSGKPRIYVDNTLKFINWLKEEKES